MNKRFLLLLAIILIFIISGCTEKEKSNLIRDEDYLIEPTTIIRELQQGQTDVLTPVEDLPLFLPVENRSIMNWGQDEYYYLLQSTFPIVWNEPLDGWEVNSIDYNLTCSNVENGFEQATYTMFRVQTASEQKTRIERKLTVNLRRNAIGMSEITYTPALAEWESIDLSKIKFSADIALQIAEERGGRDKRLAARNDCEIFVLLSPDSASYAGWLVGYTQPGEGKYLFSIFIDPVTGEITR